MSFKKRDKGPTAQQPEAAVLELFKCAVDEVLSLVKVDSDGDSLCTEELLAVGFNVALVKKLDLDGDGIIRKNAFTDALVAVVANQPEAQKIQQFLRESIAMVAHIADQRKNEALLRAGANLGAAREAAAGETSVLRSALAASEAQCAELLARPHRVTFEVLEEETPDAAVTLTKGGAHTRAETIVVKEVIDASFFKLFLVLVVGFLLGGAGGLVGRGRLLRLAAPPVFPTSRPAAAKEPPQPLKRPRFWRRK